VSNDKRMYFIRNNKNLDEKDVISHVSEYEVITDAHIIGGFTYRPYEFIIWEFSDKREGEERKLCLQVREKEFSGDKHRWEDAKS